MTEELLHFLWKYKIVATKSLVSENGAYLEILNTGEHNKNAGPDFLNARIKINNIEWIGNCIISQTDGKMFQFW